MKDIDLPALLGDLRSIALDAGRIIMEIYDRDDFSVTEKDDKSPVTEADQKAEDLIEARLLECAPGITIIAEEAVAAGRMPEAADQFFLVDPLDGTKSFCETRRRIHCEHWPWSRTAFPSRVSC